MIQTAKSRENEKENEGEDSANKIFEIQKL